MEETRNYKQEWIDFYITKYKGCRKDVIEFIADILYHSNPDESEEVRLLFSAGYCYYFAKMLQDAFGGEVCWHRGYGHIVWKDETDCCYDINGVFDDYYENDIVSLSELGQDLENFRHRGKKICDDTPLLTEEQVTKVKEFFENSKESNKALIYGNFVHNFSDIGRISKIFEFENDARFTHNFSKFERLLKRGFDVLIGYIQNN